VTDRVSRRVPRARLRAVARVFRTQDTIEQQALRDQLDLLATLRRNVLAELAEASGFRMFHLSNILNAIDQEIVRGRAQAQRLAAGSTERSFRLGGSLLDQMLGKTAFPPNLTGLSPELLQAAIDVTNDQVRSIWSELGSGLKSSVRRAALGVRDPQTAMAEVAKMLRTARPFTNAEAAAERIIRTEVGRTFSMASQRRLEDSKRSLGDGLKKYWLDAGDRRVRETHRDAGLEYGPGGSTGPIDVDEAYIVGGHSLMFPRDPRGPAEETINCRCVSVPYVEDVLVAARAA
jgi:hypothetical protein